MPTNDQQKQLDRSKWTEINANQPPIFVITPGYFFQLFANVAQCLILCQNIYQVQKDKCFNLSGLACKLEAGWRAHEKQNNVRVDDRSLLQSHRLRVDSHIGLCNRFWLPNAPINTKTKLNRAIRPWPSHIVHIDMRCSSLLCIHQSICILLIEILFWLVG